MAGYIRQDCNTVLLQSISVKNSGFEGWGWGHVVAFKYNTGSDTT